MKTLFALLIALGLYTAPPQAPGSIFAHAPVCTFAYPQGFDGVSRSGPAFDYDDLEACEPKTIPDMQTGFCVSERGV